jgi:hypothetical protein
LSSRDENFEKATEERAGVRSFLSLLHGTEHAKILITTRPQYRQELHDSFSGSIIADVHGDLDDMRAYLSQRLALASFKSFRQALRDEIVDKLLSANENEKW